MSFQADIVTLLNDDLELAGILTGGCFEYPDTGRKGLTRILTPQAFDEVDGLMQPVAMVLETDDMTDGQIVGSSMSFVTPVAIMIYDRGDTEVRYDNIEAASARIFSLLHLTQIDNVCQILYEKSVKYKREPNLMDAAYFREMYSIHAYKTVS